MRWIQSDRRGVVAIITLLGIAAFSLSVIVVITDVFISELRMVGGAGVIDDTFYAAESGLHEGLYRLIQDPAPTIHTLTLNGVPTVVTLTINPDNPYQRVIESQAIDRQGRVRTVEIIANTSSFAGGFDYAVQGGTGGIFLDNNSLINGDIYSNGDIVPASGGARGSIVGDVWVATTHALRKVDVSGDVRANTIVDSSIAGSAYYQTIDAASRVGGTACPNSFCFPGSADPIVREFPLKEDPHVNDWKNEITDLGSPILLPEPTNCPVSHEVGFYCIQANKTLGFQKIVGNLYVGHGATLTLNGNLWVTGDIILDNNGTITLDASLGSSSAVIIADGRVEVNNNYTIQGSGNPASFVLLLSLSSSVNQSTPAIYAANNSASIVFAALNGMLKVKNNGVLNAAAAHTLYLEPNSQVAYNPLLSAFTIGTGGGGEPVGTLLGSWHEK